MAKLARGRVGLRSLINSRVYCTAGRNKPWKRSTGPVERAPPRYAHLTLKVRASNGSWRGKRFCPDYASPASAPLRLLQNDNCCGRDFLASGAFCLSQKAPTTLTSSALSSLFDFSASPKRERERERERSHLPPATLLFSSSSSHGTFRVRVNPTYSCTRSVSPDKCNNLPTESVRCSTGLFYSHPNKISLLNVFRT
jgi:hypothetical protein